MSKRINLPIVTSSILTWSSLMPSIEFLASPIWFKSILVEVANPGVTDDVPPPYGVANPPISYKDNLSGVHIILYCMQDCTCCLGSSVTWDPPPSPMESTESGTGVYLSGRM